MGPLNFDDRRLIGDCHDILGYDLMDETNYLIFFSLAYHITYHHITRGRKSPGKYAEHAEDISHGIGNSQIP